MSSREKVEKAAALLKDIAYTLSSLEEIEFSDSVDAEKFIARDLFYDNPRDLLIIEALKAGLRADIEEKKKELKELGVNL